MLLPSVRDAAPETLIVADGFSCRSQIEQLQADRRALHVAQVLQLGRAQGPDSAGSYPERLRERAPWRENGRAAAKAAFAVGVAAAGAAYALRRS